MSARKIRLVAIDGTQVAPAPRRFRRDAALRQEREIMLAIIKEHLGHVAHSLERMKTLARELETSLGISLPPYTPHPLPDFPDGRPDFSA